MDAKHMYFVMSLTESERMLPVLRDELFEGKWDDMLEDLKARLNGKPYIFKLVNRIESDIAGIKKLKAFTRCTGGVDVGPLVQEYNDLIRDCSSFIKENNIVTDNRPNFNAVGFATDVIVGIMNNLRGQANQENVEVPKVLVTDIVEKISCYVEEQVAKDLKNNR